MYCDVISDISLFFFFFFQAEDGIRDLYVTGVQTCALPIYHLMLLPNLFKKRFGRHGCNLKQGVASMPEVPWMKTAETRTHRSEERRVGKECRSRWGRYQ